MESQKQNTIPKKGPYPVKKDIKSHQLNSLDNQQIMITQIELRNQSSIQSQNYQQLIQLSSQEDSMYNEEQQHKSQKQNKKLNAFQMQILEKNIELKNKEIMEYFGQINDVLVNLNNKIFKTKEKVHMVTQLDCEKNIYTLNTQIKELNLKLLDNFSLYSPQKEYIQRLLAGIQDYREEIVKLYFDIENLQKTNKQQKNQIDEYQSENLYYQQKFKKQKKKQYSDNFLSLNQSIDLGNISQSSKNHCENCKREQLNKNSLTINREETQNQFIANQLSEYLNEGNFNEKQNKIFRNLLFNIINPTCQPDLSFKSFLAQLEQQINNLNKNLNNIKLSQQPNLNQMQKIENINENINFINLQTKGIQTSTNRKSVNFIVDNNQTQTQDKFIKIQENLKNKKYNHNNNNKEEEDNKNCNTSNEEILSKILLESIKHIKNESNFSKEIYGNQNILTQRKYLNKDLKQKIIEKFVENKIVEIIIEDQYFNKANNIQNEIQFTKTDKKISKIRFPSVLNEKSQQNIDLKLTEKQNHFNTLNLVQYQKKQLKGSFSKLDQKNQKLLFQFQEKLQNKLNLNDASFTNINDITI